MLERFSIECPKTKTKEIALVSHNWHRQSSEPIKTQWSENMKLTRSAGKCVWESCTGPRMIPGPQMIPDRKWPPNWTANDPGPEMIPILDRKWSRSKNKEWHRFISEEGDNMYKNYELKNMFYHFTKKYSTAAVLFFEEYRSFSLSRNKRK